MKPNRQVAGPSAMERQAEELSGLFAQAGWAQSAQNFAQRPFVTAHGDWFVAAGSPPNKGSHSKACRTAEEVIAFLEEASRQPAPREEREPELVVEAAPPQPDARDEELETLRAKLAEMSEQLAAKPTEIIVEKIVEVPIQAPPVRDEPSAVPSSPERAEDDGIPDAFRGLMLVDESPEKFTERMRRRWNALQQYRIDGSKPTAARALPDMTEEEDAELRDLEERNRQHKWLD